MSLRSITLACILALFCLMPLAGCAPSDGGGSNGGSSDTTATE